MATRQIIRPPGPEELDQLVKVNAPVAWIAFWFLAVSLVGAIVWSFYSTAPVKITAQGIILTEQGISDVSATSQGQIEKLSFKVGDRIKKGDVIAIVVQPDILESVTAKTAELEQQKLRRSKIAEFQTATSAAQAALFDQRDSNIKERIVLLEEALALNQENEVATKSLMARGIAKNDRLLAVRIEVMETANLLNEARSELARLQTDRANLVATNARELLSLDLDLAQVLTDLESLNVQADRRSAILSDVDGTIAEVLVRPGDIVSVGQSVLRVVSEASNETDKPLVGLLYASSADGKKLKLGMPVQIIPATARVERDGYLLGRVKDVSLIPATRESIQATLRNATLVDVMTESGPPFEVVVELIPDPSTVSNYAWSNGVGLNQPIEGGTLLSAKVIVDRIPIIALVIPRAETIMAGFAGSNPQ